MNIVIPVGGGGTPVYVVRKDVNFYDYEGTLLYSYTLAEAQALVSLPAAPSHTGLTFQEWNYTLTAVNATTRPMDVGATYITDDGKTRLYIRIWDLARSNVPLVFSQTVSEGVTVDWGDGSNTETFEGTGVQTTSHQYASTGDYVISFDVDVGCTLGLGDELNSVMGEADSYYNSLLIGVEIGIRVISITSFAFNTCVSLRHITIPNSIITIGERSFRLDYSLQVVIIPSSTTGIGAYAFAYASSLWLVVLSGSVESIGEGAMNESYMFMVVRLNDGLQSVGDYLYTYNELLTSVYAPTTVTSIGIESFSQCPNLTDFYIYASTPPTLGIDAFTGCSENLTIHVPSASLSAYQAADGWSTYASKIVGE